jgi:hypothetical protein
MSAVVYSNRFTVREGKLEDLRRYAGEMTELAEQKEPDTISFNFYLDDDGRTGSAIFVFAGAEALDLHLGLVSDRFEEGAALMSSNDVELLGPASQQAIRMAKAYGGTVKPHVLAGFTRASSR